MNVQDINLSLPQGVVVLDPETGDPVPASLPPGSVLDSTGQSFSPAACTHAYGYDASGLIVTDTATLGAATWVKTYTYNASAQLTGETQWVRQ
jgi:YD repeat-containing protein